MFLAWIAQIIMNEALMIPAVIETGSASAKMNFYDPDMPFGYGEAYGHDNALKNAFSDFGCTKKKYEKGCAHVQLETWVGQRSAFERA